MIVVRDVIDGHVTYVVIKVDRCKLHIVNATRVAYLRFNGYIFLSQSILVCALWSENIRISSTAPLNQSAHMHIFKYLQQ